MKLTTLLSFLLFFSIAYCQYPCVNGVSTDINNPTNNNLPSTNGHGQYYLNGTNWFYPDDPNTTYLPFMSTATVNNSVDMINPFSDQLSQYYAYLNNSTLNPSTTPTYENGWELLAVNLGFMPDGTPISDIGQSSVFTDLPYLILYNRYSGILRLFANSGDGLAETGTGWNAIKINLEFQDPPEDWNTSGLLRLNGGFDQALDKKTSQKKMVSFAEHPNQNNHWFSTDFQLAYDPCTCFYPSKIKVSFDFIRISDIDLFSRGIEIESDLISDDNAGLPEDFLSTFEVNENGEVSGGILMYNAMETLVEKYIADLEQYKQDLAAVQQYNKKIDATVAVLKVFKTVILGAASPLISSLSAGIVADLPKEFVKKAKVNETKISEESKKILGKKLDSFIGKNFKKKKEPTKPDRPTAVFSETRFEGQMTTDIFMPGPTLFNPGTFGNTQGTNDIIQSIHQYPVYNEVLGSFAMLESPKIKHSVKKYTDNISMSTQNCNVTFEDDDGYFLYYQPIVSRSIHQNTYHQVHQFQLEEPLKYTFNPALDIISSNVKAAIVFKGNKPQTIQPSPPIFSHQLTIESDASRYANVESFEFPLENSEILNPMNEFDFSMQTPFVNINALQPLIGSFNIQSTENFEYITPVLPYCYGSYNEFGFSFSFLAPYSPGTYSSNPNNLNRRGVPTSELDFTFEYQLKVIIDIEFGTLNGVGENNSVTQIFTYNVNGDELTLVGSYIDEFINNSANDITQYPQDIGFTDTHFDGSEIENCNLKTLGGTKYKCKCWNNIFINGDITVAPGYEVDFIAGKEIYVQEEASIDSEAQLYIEPILDYSQPMPPFDDNLINSYCQNLDPNLPSYQAHIPTKNHSDQNNSSKLLLNPSSIDFDIYPNPTKNGFWIDYYLESESNFEISINDITGKTLRLFSENEFSGNGYHHHFINSSDLSRGIYLISIRLDDAVKTKRLIVN